MSKKQETPKFRTHYNALLIPRQTEINNGISLTVPGQTFTIKEILTKFSNGMELNLGHPGQFQDDPSFDDYDVTRDPDFDLADATEQLSAFTERQQQTARARARAESEARKQSESEAKAKIPGEASALD